MALAVGAWLLAGAFGVTPSAAAHPILDAKDAAVSISGTADMSITSAAANNLIKWVDFSIGKNEKVTFDAKNYLNYVTGSAVSDIQGTLKGTGNIYLVNPNGILIGDGATVNVGSLYLSTKNLTADQLANYSTATGALFKNDNAAAGDVINLGNLNATAISVEGNNITFKNVADVKNAAGTAVNTNVTLTAKSGGEIHIGSAEGGASGYTTSGGTTYNYKLVSTANELQNMKNDLDGNYMLAGDIDMSGVSFTPVGYSVLNHETGDEEDTYAFKGRFDGLGYAVKNLSVNFNYEVSDEPWADNKSGIGLFGRNKGTVENVKLSGGRIESTQGSIGIIGINGGTVRNVFNDGVTVTGSGTVGGIVGNNYAGTIKNVWNTGTVSGTSKVGGIAGNNGYGASIENAWNHGRVSGSEYYVGGIVGNNQDSIVKNVYNTGAVQSGSYSVGGIVGVNQGNSTNTIVQYAYNTGTVTCSSNSNKVGGIVGSNYAIIRNAYSKEGTAVAVSGGRGSDATENDVAIKSETDMKQKATFAGFDFSANGVWRIYEGQTMPLLTAFLTRKDNITNTTTEYNGTATGDVGAKYVTTTYNVAQTQNGYNYIKDVSFVTPKDLTVRFADISKTYDGTTEATAGTATLDGIVNSDAVGLANGVTATYADKNAGANKKVNYTGLALTGDKAKNYNLVNAATATGTGTITAKDITATVADTSKVYDGTTNATANGNLTGVIEGDTLTVTATGNYDNKNVGTGKTVNYTGFALSGSEAGNYNLTTTAATGTGEITRKALSLVATPQTITEGEATPTAWSGSVTGFVTGEGLDANDTLSFALDNPAAAAVGSYKVTGMLSIGGAAPLASGNYGANYTFANAAANDTAFTIAAKSMTPQDIIDNPNAAQEYANTLTFIERDTRDENQAAPPQEKLAAGTTASRASHLTIENGGVNTPPNMDVAAALAAEASAEQTAATQESEEEEA